ncbi:hypothetical protein HPP92_016832 [Vanilla planifolia]|uniref:Auxin-responsive protein n=1 Tax=Vanilla planifolia TaxID=51239 RepID=A0A835UUK5_VANPL|nr:hypothetical protein HPP92_017414 [Vanilla planifolia]KAG0472286.1 hypothetical protein HPP92_016832 [Vanilla planifolia]
MAGTGSSYQETLKRRWDESAAFASGSCSQLPPPATIKPLSLSNDGMSLAGFQPSVTVYKEGSSICHRVQLDRHAGYESLAAALHRIFANDNADGHPRLYGRLDLSNAVPGHMVAYEDIEDDLLLAGDLSWKDFLRVVKRIRIIPTKPRRRKLRTD